MNAEFRNRQLPYNSPFANVLVVVVGAIAIALSFVIGVVALFALAAAVMVLGAIIGVRLWWLRLKARRQRGESMPDDRSDSGHSQGTAVIEGEYQVIPVDKKGDEPPQT